MERKKVVKNILLTHFYSERNSGDAAILFVMVENLRKIFSGAELSLVTMDEFGTGEKVESLNLLHSFFYDAIYVNKNILFRICKVLWICVTTIIWAWFFRVLGWQLNWLVGKSEQVTLLAYTRSNLIVPVGGGYILGKNSLHGTVTVLLQLHAIYIGIILKKPIVLFPQSIGPFGNWLQRFMASFVLNRVSAIFVRERLSLGTLSELKVTKPFVRIAADMALLLKENSTDVGCDILEQCGIHSTKPLIAVTVRDWLSNDSQLEFERSVAEFAGFLAEQGYSVVFVPQVTSGFHNDDDSIVQERIRNFLPANSNNIYFLPRGLSFRQVQLVYKACAYVIGTRMHSVIFALIAHVPALAIAYERKTYGVMTELGLQDYVVKIEEVTLELLIQKFQQLVEQRSSYLLTLNDQLPKQQTLALSVFEHVGLIFTQE